MYAFYGEFYTINECIIKDVINRTDFGANTIYKNDILFPPSTTVDADSLISPTCLNDGKAETSGVFVIRPKEILKEILSVIIQKAIQNK
ncbi:MAG: hypothetical protein SOZ83_01240 [Sphaerochaetaceae bacterium]|nr:hypothetical protein [Sphaerochaetaceae bacterium]